MTIYVLFWLALCIIVIAALFWAHGQSETPDVKSHDAIDEEIRRQRLELHNTSLTYADLQGEKDAATVVKLAAAFRSGAQWQQRQP